MPSPEGALLTANGFCTVRLAQGSQLTTPGHSQDSFAAALPSFPHPSTKGGTHAITRTVLSKQPTLPRAHELALRETGEAHSAEAAAGRAREEASSCKAQDWSSLKNIYTYIYTCRYMKLTFSAGRQHHGALGRQRRRARSNQMLL